MNPEKKSESSKTENGTPTAALKQKQKNQSV
jgi:hypothetical protein